MTSPSKTKRFTFTMSEGQYLQLQEFRKQILFESGVKMPTATLVHQLIFNPESSLLQVQSENLAQ